MEVPPWALVSTTTHTSITSDSTFKHVLRVVLAIIFLHTSRVTTFRLMFLFYYCTNVIITSLIRSTCTPEGKTNAIIMWCSSSFVEEVHLRSRNRAALEERLRQCHQKLYKRCDMHEGVVV